MPKPFKAGGLGLDGHKLAGEAALLAGGFSPCGPTAKSGTQFEHDEAILRGQDGFKKIDPFKVFLVEGRRIGCLRALSLCGRRSVVGQAVLTTKRIHMEASGGVEPVQRLKREKTS